MSERTRGEPDPLVVAHVIGQLPRPDLSADLERRFPTTRFRLVGALDGLSADEIPTAAPGEYPLETRLKDGSRVVVDACFVASRVRDTIETHDDATVHLVLCAGPFADLEAPVAAEGRSRLLLPFDVAVAELTERGCQRFDIVVPFTAQAAPALEKWGDAGFTCRAHALAEKPNECPLAEWLAELVGESDAEALVFDYVGFPVDALSNVAAQLDIPVYDLGHLALDVLEQTLTSS